MCEMYDLGSRSRLSVVGECACVERLGNGVW